ncbi:hypothetical protein O181_017810 [Austropuccinia psidii MF-1]|uniref:Uncharacterized protein n=1 Tax=Austropuccinia psidii MF-1 TaxID=1389203 RepID=A0A9Q3C8J5_9BASI|nr:hypothetical protein [Austropuccinia psidii MF-1]
MCCINIENAFASENEPGGAIRRHEVNITLNIDRPYPLVLIRPPYPESPRAREALEKHIKELTQLCVRRKVCHNKEVEVKTPVDMFGTMINQGWLEFLEL